MGVANSNTHIANATGMPLRIYYEVTKMELHELATEVSLLGRVFNGNLKLVFKRDSRVRYMYLPVNEVCKFAGEGELFVSVLVEKKRRFRNYCLKTIALNFHVPSDRSFIVTANHTIKFQRYGDDIWIDDSGYNHRPKRHYS